MFVPTMVWRVKGSHLSPKAAAARRKHPTDFAVATPEGWTETVQFDVLVLTGGPELESVETAFWHGFSGAHDHLAGADYDRADWQLIIEHVEYLGSALFDRCEVSA